MVPGPESVVCIQKDLRPRVFISLWAKSKGRERLMPHSVAERRTPKTKGDLPGGWLSIWVLESALLLGNCDVELSFPPFVPPFPHLSSGNRHAYLTEVSIKANSSKLCALPLCLSPLCGKPCSKHFHADL